MALPEFPGNQPETNWWEDPPPPGYTGAWPPPLPPGAQYGNTPGTIIENNGDGGLLPGRITFIPGWPGQQTPTQGITDPNVKVLKEPSGPVGPPTTGPTSPPGPSQPPTKTGGEDPNAPQVKPGPAPTPDIPPYTPPPAFAPPPKFEYPDFTPPTGDDVLNDPGYQFRLREGSDAIERSAAAKGVLNTGGTLKDVLGYGQNLASTEYGNLFGRAAQTYGMNRGNAVQNYNTNYNTQYLDPYTINYQSQYKDPFQFNFDTSMANYGAKQHNYDQDLYYGQHNTDLSRMYDWYHTQLDYQKQRDQFKDRLSLLDYLY